MAICPFLGTGYIYRLRRLPRSWLPLTEFLNWVRGLGITMTDLTRRGFWWQSHPPLLLLLFCSNQLPYIADSPYNARFRSDGKVDSSEPEVHGDGLKSTLVFHGYHPSAFVTRWVKFVTVQCSPQALNIIPDSGQVAKWIEHPPLKLLVLGSNPARSMNITPFPQSLKSPQRRGHSWIFELSEGGGNNQKNS